MFHEQQLAVPPGGKFYGCVPFCMILGLLFCVILSLQSQDITRLSSWQEGYLDIHHISTGRGNATYLIFPDGTTMLIDAGDISETHARTTSARNSVLKPDRSKSAPEWIIDYILQVSPFVEEPILDYALITHYHDDHFGEWDETRPVSANGAYHLTGIMAVGDSIPIRTLIDRGSDFPVDLKSMDFRQAWIDDEYHLIQTLEEYRKFITWQKLNTGLQHETLLPGSASQVTLKVHPERYPNFSIRGIAVNGQIWTGYADDETFSLVKQGEYHGENALSACIKISYGKFDYFTGGDISGVNTHGESDINGVESHIAPVVGAVDVVTLNHHGNRDSQNTYYVRTLRPRVWIGQSWSSDHPGHDVLRRITASTIYPGDRDIYTTDMLESNRLVIGDLVDRAYRNLHGHIVVRVFPGGDSYEVFVLNDLSSQREILQYGGQYLSR